MQELKRTETKLSIGIRLDYLINACFVLEGIIHNNGIAVLERIEVAEQHRRNRIGSNGYLKFEKEAIEQGSKILCCKTEKGDMPISNFLLKNGFKRTKDEQILNAVRAWKGFELGWVKRFND